MEDDLDSSYGVVNPLVAPELALDEVDVPIEPGQIGAVAGREVVEHAHLVAPREEGANDVRADEAGSAGDEDPHAGVTVLNTRLFLDGGGSCRREAEQETRRGLEWDTSDNP